MRKGNPYNSCRGFAAGSRKLRLIALFLVCAFCFLQQAAELHYVQTHSVRSVRGVSAAASKTREFGPATRSSDSCALCAIDATILRPGAVPQNLLVRPDTVSIVSPFTALLPAGNAPDFRANPSSPRAPPSTFSLIA